MEESNIQNTEISLDGLFSENDGAEGNQTDEQQPQAALSEQEIAYRALQSKYDQTVAQLQQAKQTQELWEQFVADPETRRSIIAEVEPDLIKAPNPTDYVRNNLVKEFGDDFESKWENGSVFEKMQIQTRFQQLQENATKGYQAPKPFKELTAAQKAKAKKEMEEVQAQLNDIKTKFNWDDNVMNGFQEWTKNLQLENFASAYNNALRSKNATVNAPNFANVPGQANIKKTNTYLDELNQTFGKPPEPLMKG